MRKIPVKGSRKPAIVDDEDFELVSQWEWHVVSGPHGAHAATWVSGREVLMEHLIIWAALLQGAEVQPDGTVSHRVRHRVTADVSKERLETIARSHPINYVEIERLRQSAETPQR